MLDAKVVKIPLGMELDIRDTEIATKYRYQKLLRSLMCLCVPDLI